MFPRTWRVACVALIGLASSISASAEDFPTFRVGAAAGWVETSNTATKRIKVFPLVSGPGGVYWSKAADPWGFNAYNPASEPQGLQFTGDGRLAVGFRVTTDRRFLSDTFKASIARQLGLADNALDSHTIQFIQPKDLVATLEVEGREVATKTVPGLLAGGDLTEYFYLDGSDDRDIAAILRGDYRVIVSYRAPYASFGLVEISLDQKILTTAWTETFRELIKRRQSSSTGFLFFKFRDEVQRVIARENMRGGANTKVEQNLAITRVDPDPTQVALIDKAIGIIETSRNDVVALHTAAIAAAKNDPVLKAAHEKYLENLSSDPGKSTDWLAALQKLTDDKVMQFLASGFEASSGNAYSYYRYTGSSSISANTEASTRYSDYLIKNSEAGFRQAADGSSDSISAATMYLRAKYFGNYGVSMTPEWASAVGKIIKSNDLGGLQFAFSDALEPSSTGGPLSPVIDVNAPADTDGNTLLHLAVERRNLAMVRYLIAKGADPEARNRFGETPIDGAAAWGDPAAKTELQAAVQAPGSALIEVTSLGGAFQTAMTMGPRSASTQFLETKPGVTTIKVTGHPGIFRGAWVLTYQATVPVSSLPLPFPYRIVSSNGVQAVVSYSASVTNKYKLFPGQDQTYTEKLSVKGPSMISN